MMISPLLQLLDRVSPPEKVSAHCDVPCGIYDPYAAQIAALTVVRMNQLLEGVELPAAPDKAKLNTMARHIVVKEQHAELVKKEIDIIWHDYFRPEHLEKVPDLHDLVWQANKLASKCKQEFNLQASWDLLAAVQKVAEAFWMTKGVATRKISSNQTVGGELVVPA
jgi:nickel superoxide dismutase